MLNAKVRARGEKKERTRENVFRQFYLPLFIAVIGFNTSPHLQVNSHTKLRGNREKR